MNDMPPVMSEVVEDALTTDRKSVRIPRVEVITRGERRRVWSVEQKREIVAESLGPDLTPTQVARKHGISSGRAHLSGVWLYRHAQRDGGPGDAGATGPWRGPIQ